MIRPYKINITFNKKKYEIIIHIKDREDKEYHYDMELMTSDRISGDEFQKLKKFLEDEGYIDEAIKYYEKYY
jgi:hypothetical protein